MLDFDEARRRLLSAAVSLAGESVPLRAAVGRVLADDVQAETPLPAFDYSAMDGYAVASTELSSPSFTKGVGGPNAVADLQVSGESRAGSKAARLPPGTAFRIFTGAPLPEGADSVVIQENTRRDGDRVILQVLPRPSENVRRAGEDLPRGAVALSHGTRLGPFQLGLLAALDRDTVEVARRPRVAIVSTGDELRPPGSAPVDGTIPESNAVAIRAMAELAGSEVVFQGHVRDDLATAASTFDELLDRADVLVSIGGVSVGDHDVVRAALERAGAALEFWKVAIRPGKPFTFGRRKSALIVGLPGNPVSAQLTFALLGVPLLRALQGDRGAVPLVTRVRLAEPFRQTPGRLGAYRARLEGAVACLQKNQASGSAVSLALADALVLIPADVSGYDAGTLVDAIRLADL